MKTETQIAQENVKDIKSLEDGDFDGQSPLKRMSDFTELKKQSLTHKATCQRFLEFLEGFWNSSLLCSVRNIGGKAIDDMNNKYRDLNQAIKLYNEAGI